MGKVSIFVIAAGIIYLVFSQSCMGQEKERETSAIEKSMEKMRATPDLVAPGDIYIGYALEKLRNQNTEIIEILEMMREQAREISKQNSEIIKLLTEIRDLFSAAPSQSTEGQTSSSAE